MVKVGRTWDVLTKTQRQKAIQEIVDYFSSARDEEIGVIAADSLLDMFLQTCGANIYNKGVEDAKQIISNRLEDTLLELDFTLKIDN